MNDDSGERHVGMTVMAVSVVAGLAVAVLWQSLDSRTAAALAAGWIAVAVTVLLVAAMSVAVSLRRIADTALVAYTDSRSLIRRMTPRAAEERGSAEEILSRLGDGEARLAGDEAEGED